jgi:Type II secretion system (T2SS), protein M
MTTRDRTMVLVLVLAVLVAAGWFLVLAPMRDEAGSLSSQIDVQRQTLATALADAAAGTQARRRYAHDYATVARLGAAVPEDDNVASLLVQVQHAAGASDVDFRSLKVGQGAGAATPAPPPPPPTTTGGAAATQATTATLPPGALVGPAGFPTMPFAFTFTGDFFKLSDFVGRLERFLVVRNRRVSVSGRFMTIDGIGLIAAPQGFPRIEASVAATTYLLPAAQGLTGGATADGPATATPASATGASGGAPSPIPAATATPVAP